MPSKDINVRRETARRCYRRKVEKNKELQRKKHAEFISCEQIFTEIGDVIREKSLSGWVSPEFVNGICRKNMDKFNLLSIKSVIYGVELYGYLWHAHEVGVFMGTAPFLNDLLPFEYFKKRVPLTQKKALKAELLILQTMLKFIKKGQDPETFQDYWALQHNIKLYRP
jgi:hypothetical protein